MTAQENIKTLETKLWDAANHLRANSPLRLSEFAEPVLGLIFLKFADVKFARAQEEIKQEHTKNQSARKRPVTSADFHARHVVALPPSARFSALMALSEETNMGRAINEAMRAIEKENTDLAGVLPKSYQKLDNPSIIALLKNFNQIPDDIEGDAFGRIYEYFLGNFAIADGSRGGEFFTPTSIVRLIVEVLEPYHGKIFDPACGSGGMFVQSYEFVRRRLKNGNGTHAARELSIYGQEVTDQTVRIAKMNLAIHGLSGDIKQGNAYYEDLHKSIGAFDFTMANPPFNVDNIDASRMKGDARMAHGLPLTQKGIVPNGNFVWIQIFLSALNKKGRAGFVMANSAADAGHSEKEIRTKLVEDGVVDVMVAVGPNMFYNVALPVTLWFLDKSKKGSARENKILFIDARNIYRQLDRAHRDWTDEQIEQIAGMVRSYRGEEGAKPYEDIKGLRRVATLDEVKAAGYSLNPGRYVGAADNGIADDHDFAEKIAALHDEFATLTKEAHILEKKIFENLKKLDVEKAK